MSNNNNVWTLAIERANEVGEESARVLLQSDDGHWPATLCGYSMGARMVYSCLKELTRHQQLWEQDQEQEQTQRRAFGVKTSPYASYSSYKREPVSIVEDVHYLMGCAQHIPLESWRICRRLVAGRLVSCYSKSDLILGLVFQLKRVKLGVSATSIFRPVCGTHPIDMHGVENVDISSLVSQHATIVHTNCKIFSNLLAMANLVWIPCSYVS
jgi:hypothetical protein